MGNNPQDFENNAGSALQVIDETAMEPICALSTQGEWVVIKEIPLPLSPTGLNRSPDKILPNVNRRPNSKSRLVDSDGVGTDGSFGLAFPSR